MFSLLSARLCSRGFLAAILSFGSFNPLFLPAQEPAKIGDTRVARWKDDKKAVFLLMFDDGWPSHFQVVMPELAARGMIATFYICPAKVEYKKFEKEWAELVAAHGMILANHTMTHGGVKDLENARYEILDCTKEIRRLQPGKEGRCGGQCSPSTIGQLRAVEGARQLLEQRCNETTIRQLLGAAAGGGSPEIVTLCLSNLDRAHPALNHVISSPLSQTNHAPYSARPQDFDRSTYPECLRLLLSHGADVNVVDKRGCSLR